MDLKPNDETSISSIDNGDWDGEFFDHWCLGAQYCELCGGDPDAALDLMVVAVELSSGACSRTPLAYRWKGVEAFACKLYRGMRQHKLSVYSHLELFPPSKTRQARLGGCGRAQPSNHPTQDPNSWWTNCGHADGR